MFLDLLYTTAKNYLNEETEYHETENHVWL